MSFELTAGPLPIVSAISYLYGLEVVKCELTMSQYADPVRPEKALDGFADVSVDSPGASAMLVKVSHFQRHGMLRFLGDGHSRRQNGSARRSLRIIKTEIGISERIAHKPGKREVMIYDYADLDEISLAYAVSVHKAQGSEFPAVVMPIVTQHYLLLQRNLLYTAVTRGRQLVVLIGTKKALAIAVHNDKTRRRSTGLCRRLAKG